MNVYAKIRHQKLPSSGPEREALREKGQFWTPDWVAEAMVAYVTLGGRDHIFDPAVGAGAFFRAAKALEQQLGRKLTLLGTELDSAALQEALERGLSKDDLANLQIGDFVLDPPARRFKAIVANPPYIRHHRLPAPLKTALRTFGAKLIGKPLDGRAGLHVYFLLRALQLLDGDGRLAFIMPADTCEGVFAPTLWNWITRKYRLEAVVTFSPEATPFPAVDTNPLIFMLRNASPEDEFLWVRCTQAWTQDLKAWALSGLPAISGSALWVQHRRLAEGLGTGLSRPPVEQTVSDLTLGHFAKVLRGIVTGANEFFLLTSNQAADLGITGEFLVCAVARTRDVPGFEITVETLMELDAKGRPTLLLSLDNRPVDRFPEAVREYVKLGETIGITKRPLVAARNPWYKMEVRCPPPFLFAYLGRRNARFIRNLAGVVPLTSFLCVYPREPDESFVKRLWQVLRHPETVSNLVFVGKSYGDGCIKVEPRALEKLPLPRTVVAEAELELPAKVSNYSLFDRCSLRP